MIKLEDIPFSLAPLIAADRRYWERMMDHTDAVRWALIDLLKALDAIYGGQFHAEFARIALTLDVELAELPQVHDDRGGNGKLAVDD